MEDFLNYMTKQSLGLYCNAAQGTLLVRLHADSAAKRDSRTQLPACSDQPVALVTEHRLFGSRQYTLRFDSNSAETGMQLPAGDYTVSVTAPGHKPFRQFVTVANGKTSEVYAKLTVAETKEQSLADILSRNMIPSRDRQVRSLKLEEGQHLVLDENARDYRADLAQIELKSIRAVKEVLGTPDAMFVDQHPRFGQASIAREQSWPKNENALSISQRAALQEYVYGNSRSVAHWESPLDELIRLNPIAIGLFILDDIDVGPYATLDVGHGGLLCNTLSVHYTGRVRYKGAGPGKIEMNHYVRYGLLTVAGAVTKPWAHINS